MVTQKYRKMDGREKARIQSKLICKIVSVTFENCGMTDSFSYFSELLNDTLKFW